MVYFFFFKQKTAYEIYQCDWSSDVCSSDLLPIKADLLYANRSTNFDTRSLTFVQQHFQYLPGGIIAKQLAARLFMIGNAVTLNQLYKVIRCVATQCRFTIVRILR